MTPIDWKLWQETLAESLPPLGHHSLVTPIDWKLNLKIDGTEEAQDESPLAGDTY